MNILIVAATKLEIKPFLQKINFQNDNWSGFITTNFKDIKLDVLITGIGLVFTTYHLSKALTKNKYDLVINAGIAGSFNKNLKIGQVVNVIQEEFSDLGIEEPNNLKTLFEFSFIDKNDFPFTEGKLVNNSKTIHYIKSLKEVKGISSNTAHGKESSISFLKNKFSAEIETMEGAAFFYVCLQEKKQFIELRSISNYVEPRNIANWDIALAINRLGSTLLGFLEEINK